MTTMTKALAALAALLWVGAAQAQTVTPQGRLTLTSATPVMTTDTTAATTVYYDCYAGNNVPVGSTPSNLTIPSCEVSMGLSTSNVASGSVYDIFGVSNSGTLVICVGPAWSSTTARGTGAGTTQLDQTNGGLWTNENSLTHCYGGAAGTTDYGSVAAHAATYLGSLYATANGQTGMQFAPAAAAGGSNNVLALYNAYNRVLFHSLSRDNTSSWTYSTATWRAADNSNSNRINWLDGLIQSQVTASWQAFCGNQGGNNYSVGVNFDSTSATPGGVVGDSYYSGSTSFSSIAGGNSTIALGWHYAQAMEDVQGGTVTCDGVENSAVLMGLSLFLMD